MAIAEPADARRSQVRGKRRSNERAGRQWWWRANGRGRQGCHWTGPHRAFWRRFGCHPLVQRRLLPTLGGARPARGGQQCSRRHIATSHDHVPLSRSPAACWESIIYQAVCPLALSRRRPRPLLNRSDRASGLVPLLPPDRICAFSQLQFRRLALVGVRGRWACSLA